MASSTILIYAGIPLSASKLGFFWNSRPFKIVTEAGNITQEITGKITSKPALGFLGLLGADYPLNDKLTLFGELGFEQISFSLDKYVVEEPNKQTIYYSEDDANTNNLNPQKVPGSSFQIRAGVRFAIK